MTPQSNRGIDVVQVGSYPPPHGGQSVHVQNLTAFLRKSGMTVRVLNTGSNKAVQGDGVESVASSMGLLRTLLSGPDVRLLHVHVAGAADHGKLAPVVSAAAIRRFPWIVTIHSGNGADQLRSADGLRRGVLSAMLRRAETIICVNESVSAQLSTLLKHQSIVVIPPFSFGFTGAALRPDLERFFADHDPVITSVGFYEPIYGFDQAVKLMTTLRAHHPRAGLLLVGDLKGSEPCEALVRELGLGETVKLAGNLGHDECLAVMQRSSLFLRATQYDGDSLSVREALSLGVPVVATATAFRPEGVISYQPGVFDELVCKTLEALGNGGRRIDCAPDDNHYLEQVRQVYLKKR